MNTLNNPDGSFQFGEWTVRPASNELINDRESIRVEHKVMQLMVYFVDHAGLDLSKDDILTNVWGDGVHNEEVLTVAVSALRKALGDSPKSPRYIKTLPRFGYRMLEHPGTPLDAAPTWFHVLSEKIGFRFLIVASLVGLFLTIILVQVIVEIVFLLTR